MSMSFQVHSRCQVCANQSLLRFNTQCLSIKLCPSSDRLVLFKCSEAMAFSSDESIKFMQTCEDAMFAAMSKKDQDEQYPVWF